jgi:uncharacterized protein YegJ (DUF2314 family)
MRLPIAALAFLALVPAVSFGQPSQTRDPIVKVAPGDPEMTQAIAKAQTTLDRFIATLRSPKSWQQSFLIKGRFTALGEVEHIWVADLTFDGRLFHGVLANEPRLPGLKFKQLVFVPREDVSDWMYVANNKLVGGYTIRVLRKHQSKDEREREDASRPYAIDNEG